MGGASGQRLFIDLEGNGVMQGWEEIMGQTAKRLCEPFIVGRNDKTSKLSILNYHPARHVIIKPHPDVLQFITNQGWPNKPRVHIYPGRWQDFLVDVQESKIQANFNVIYWDTFSEGYRSLKGFFDNVSNRLSGSEARFSWFHGLGATSRMLYDIYTEMEEMEMREAGLRVSWSEVPVDGGEALWEGIKQQYWDILEIVCLYFLQVPGTSWGVPLAPAPHPPGGARCGTWYLFL
ncbi:uncharacterized protein PGTG_12515 [Puccinia graminis f. sp. tritici CRL 75-36-700-3]|uniref:Uncharacterized protein n=1 Tax=Puccinia graminis f. sp. tritici (strain CRL 75-36-700-3 / race SCCL) TaxID=418459 RepID=E3KUW8_PUCGT|nr:uncharacterized protein PGTG_12515 [Puccinia graminis f. sp. tritici CRL 75-36-700-3]EFP88068.2 hypothetical protein PGTG_12515 [Puccinia graminis f. sp. tritici CRL 75-36-700-3]